MDLLLSEVGNKERIKDIFIFFSKARRLGAFLIVSGLASVLIAVFQSIEGHNVAVLLIFISIVASILGLVNYHKAIPIMFITCGIFYILLGILNFILADELGKSIMLIQLIIGLLCLKKYSDNKKLKITEGDRSKFNDLLRMFKSTDNFIKIKIYDAIESRVVKGVLVGNDILLRSRYGTELYIIDKGDLTISSVKDNQSKKVKGVIWMNGKEQKFLVSNKYYNVLNSWLFSPLISLDKSVLTLVN